MKSEGISLSANQKKIVAQAKVAEIKPSKKHVFSLVGVRNSSTLEESIQRYGIMNHLWSIKLCIIVVPIWFTILEQILAITRCSFQGIKMQKSCVY